MSCGNGWGQSPWGISPWGVGQGWGDSPWGGTPWGGCYETPQPPVQEQTAGWGRYERVRRQWQQEERRERVVRNVILAVSGLHARIRSGKLQIVAGTGTRLRIHSQRLDCTLGLVEVNADGALEILAPDATVCECGEPEVSASCVVNLSESSSTTGAGTPSVRAIRNLTDEEFLMMLAEIA